MLIPEVSFTINKNGCGMIVNETIILKRDQMTQK